MTEATGGRRYYNCQWAQDDVETLYNQLNNIIIITIVKYTRCVDCGGTVTRSVTKHVFLTTWCKVQGGSGQRI